MTTTVTKSIGTSSRDYSTMQAWEDACPANLVTADQVWKGECYNDSEFTAGVSFSGVTTDATRYLWLTTAAGQGFKDHATASTNPLDYDRTKGVGMRTVGAYAGVAHGIAVGTFVLVENIQWFYNSGFGSGYYQPILCGSANATIRGCIYKSNRTGGFGAWRWGGSGQSGGKIVNCAFILDGSCSYAHDCTSVTFVGCTIVRTSNNAAGGQGFHERYNHPTVIDCFISGFTTGAFHGTLASYGAGTGYNASDTALANMPGSNNQASLVAADQLQSVGSSPDLRAKTTGALPLNGQRQQTYTNDLDIIQQARSLTTPTIGAWEGAAAATGASARWFFT